METNQDVKYTLKLDGLDRLEKGMQSAKGHTDALDHSMHHLKEVAMELVAVYAGFEVLKESVQEWRAHSEAVARLTQMYDNNQATVHESLDQLKELAEKQETLTGIHSENTMAAEANLMKYRELKISYEELIPVASDFAKVQGTDVAEAANLMGRALTHPEKAMRLLMQAGIALDRNQIAVLTRMEKTGGGAKAQGILFDLLKDKFHGVAQAVFESNPLNQLDIQFKQMKESLGEFITQGLAVVVPYIIKMMEAVKASVHWLEQHKQLLKEIAIALSVAIASYYTITGIMFIYNAYLGFMAIQTALAVAGIEGMTIAQTALNLVMSINPVLAFVAAIGVLTLAIVDCYNSYEKLEDAINKNIHSARETEIKAVQDLTDTYVKYGDSIDVARKKAIEFEKSGVKKEIEDLQDKLDVEETGTEGYARVMRLLTAARVKESVLTDSANVFDKKGKGSGIQKELTLGKESDKVSGTKQVIINVSINKLVELIKIVAANTKEGINNAAPDVAKALLGAVDQFAASSDI